MSDIIRFFSWDGNGFMHEDADGEYVLYEDHKAEVERLKALIICLSRPIDGDSAWVLEDEENEAIAAIWREKEQRDAHEVATQGGDAMSDIQTSAPKTTTKDDI